LTRRSGIQDPVKLIYARDGVGGLTRLCCPGAAVSCLSAYVGVMLVLARLVALVLTAQRRACPCWRNRGNSAAAAAASSVLLQRQVVRQAHLAGESLKGGVAQTQPLMAESGPGIRAHGLRGDEACDAYKESVQRPPRWHCAPATPLLALLPARERFVPRCLSRCKTPSRKRNSKRSWKRLAGNTSCKQSSACASADAARE
jgi:hypothetical protein